MSFGNNGRLAHVLLIVDHVARNHNRPAFMGAGSKYCGGNLYLPPCVRDLPTLQTNEASHTRRNTSSRPCVCAKLSSSLTKSDFIRDMYASIVVSHMHPHLSGYPTSRKKAPLGLRVWPMCCWDAAAVTSADPRTKPPPLCCGDIAYLACVSMSAAMRVLAMQRPRARPRQLAGDTCIVMLLPSDKLSMLRGTRTPKNKQNQTKQKAKHWCQLLKSASRAHCHR